MSDLLGCFHSGATVRPHAPLDALEHEACENSGECCGAGGPHGFQCTRPPHTDGDHVASGFDRVFERWLFGEQHGPGFGVGILDAHT